MRKAYYLVCKRVKKQAERIKAYLDQKHNVQDLEFKAGDPVFLKNNCRQDKLDVHWLPHYRILVRTGKYTYILQHQLTGKNRRAHANHLRLAVESDNWDEPHNRTRRKVRYPTHDLEESASDEGTDNSEDEVSTIEERSEDDLEEISDNNDRESENENSDNEHTPAGDVDVKHR